VRCADAIIAFGGRDVAVADQAARLHREGWAPWIVATGGVPFDARRCEAEAFADRMVELGVPRGRILIEPCSMHTGENVRFALDLLRERAGRPRTLIAVPWPFAARRAAATLRRQAPGVDVICAPDRTGPGGRRPFGPRARRFALEELDRLDRYVEAGFIDTQRIPARVRSAGAALAAEVGLVSPEMTAV
jgi:uncharacterized SAM-binding protein YcdF (DUF218 family)